MPFCVGLAKKLALVSAAICAAIIICVRTVAVASAAEISIDMRNQSINQKVARCIYENIIGKSPDQALEIPQVDGPIPTKGLAALIHAMLGGPETYLMNVVDDGRAGFSNADGRALVDIANPRYERNPLWKESRNWMDERYAIVDAYADRSEGFATATHGPYKKLTEETAPTTFAFTWAEFTREQVEGRNLKDLVEEHKYELPVEKTLSSDKLKRTIKKPLTRYFDSRGRGILIECRINSKGELAPDGAAQLSLIRSVQAILYRLKDYPELYDKPIITAYADKLHRRLYKQQYGMEVQEETTPLDEPAITVTSEGKEIPWWVIQGTPRQWEALLFKLTGQHLIKGLNQPHPFKLWNGETASASPHSIISFDNDNHATHATLNAEAEIAPGIFAGPGVEVWWHNQKLHQVNATSRPTTLHIDGTGTIEIPAGAKLKFDPDASDERDAYGELRIDEDPNWTLFHMKNALKIEPSEIIESEARPIKIHIPGISLEASGLALNQTASTIDAHLTAPADLGEGIVGAPGHPLIIRNEQGQWNWVEITLDADVTIHGVQYKKGSHLIQKDHEIQVQK
jgi:hypothetical protein